MKTRILPTARLSFAFASVLAALFAAPSARADTYYYDNNTNATGFGTAGGTWAAPTPGPTPGWTTNTTGTAVPGSVTTATGDTLNFGNGATGLGAGTITVSGTVDAGDMTFASGSGAIVLSGGTINLAAAETITVNNASDIISSVLTGAATTLTKAGSGILTLSGAETYTGATTVNGGTLSITGSGAIYSNLGWAGKVVRVNNAVLEIDRWNIAGSLGENDYGSGNLVLNGGTLRYIGSETLTRTDDNNSRSFSLGAGGGTLESAAAAGKEWVFTSALPSFSTTLTLAGFGNGYIKNAISGTGGLVKTGDGTWTLGAINTYTGDTTVNGGTLSLINGGASGAIRGVLNINAGGTVRHDFGNALGYDSTRVAIVNINGGTMIGNTGIQMVNWGATWNLTGANIFGENTSLIALGGGGADPLAAVNTLASATTSIFSGTGTAAISLQQANLTFDVADGTAATDLRISLPISGSGNGITKTGAGTMELSGVNTYTGGTTVNTGTLLTTKATALASYTTAGKVVFNGGTVGVLMGDGSTTGWSKAQVDALLTSATKTSGALGVDTTNGSLSQNSVFTLANLNGTSLELNKLGINTLTMDQANTYSGATAVNAGTLLVNNSLAGGAVTVNGGTLGGNGTIGGSVTVAAAGSAAPGSATGTAGTLNIGNGLDVSAMANGGTGKLRFDLDAPPPAVNNDKIAVTGGLTIGTGVLDYSDFVFNNLGGVAPGTYTLITTTTGISGTLDSTPANLSGTIGANTGTLQVNGNSLELVVVSSADTTPPTLAGSGIVDNKSGGPVVYGEAVTYTVTFSEAMDALTVEATDFGNAGSAAATITSVDQTAPAIFSVQVTPTGTGTLQLRVNAGAELKDSAGNALNTLSAIPDDTTLTVNQRPVTVTAAAKTKTYGDADPALTYQITSGSLVGSDSFSGALSRNAGETAGPYAITQGTLALNANYTLTYVGANLTINPRPVTVTADAKTKMLGDPDPALTYQITSGSLVSGDSFTGALSRNAGETPGTYAITQGTLALNANYTLTYVGANLMIIAPRWWDGANTGGSGNGASDGGTANWDTSTVNWDNGNGVARVAWVNANNDNAFFAGAAGTVTLGTGITVGDLQFDTAGYVITGNTLTLGTAGAMTVNVDATISSVLAGSGSLTKAGAGEADPQRGRNLHRRHDGQWRHVVDHWFRRDLLQPRLGRQSGQGKQRGAGD